MDSDSSGLVTIVLDRQALADQVRAIEYFLAIRLRTLVGRAERLIHRYHVGDPAFGADDAVQDALLKLWQAVMDGKIHSIETEEALTKLVQHKLNQKVLDERAREDTCKRGGLCTRHFDVDLEAIDSRIPPPDEQIIAEQEVEWILGLLEVQGPILRAVATKKAEGFTHRQIADYLGESLSAVKHHVRLIKAILGPVDGELYWKNCEIANLSDEISGY